ncbi:MAG TPA: TRAP transporter substrate-binding protein DctP [Chloroflexota bacterium]
MFDKQQRPIDRRKFLKTMGAAVGATVLGSVAAACSSAPTPPSAPTGAPAAQPAAAAAAPAAQATAPAVASAAGKGKVIRVASVVAPGGAVEKSVNDFAKMISERTSGELTVQSYLGGQLGGEVQMIDLHAMGSPEVVVFGSAPLDNIAPEWGLVLDVPFLMKSQAQFRKIVDGPLGQPAKDAVLQRKGIRIVAYCNRGPRYLTSNKPINTPADLKGVKMRVPEVEVSVAAWKLLGAVVTPMAMPELYLALKQGTVEAEENPYELVWTSKWYEVQKYLNQTAHVIGAYAITVSDKWLQSLPKEQQKIVTDSLVEMAKQEDKYEDEDEAGYVTKLKGAGMIFNPVDIDQFKAGMKDLPKQFEGRWQPGFYEAVQGA